MFPTGEQEEDPEFDCGSTEYGAKGYYHLTLETQDGWMAQILGISSR